MNKLFAHLRKAWRKKLNLLRNEAGFGLIEVLVSTIIMAGLVAAILVAYSSLPASATQGNAVVVLQQDVTLAMEDMALAVRESASGDLDATSVANQLTTTAGVYSVSSGLLNKTVGGVDTILFGDYTFESFGMEVASLTFDDDSDDATAINTITITLVVNLNQTVLVDGGPVTNTVDTLTFSTKAFPRNRT